MNNYLIKVSKITAVILIVLVALGCSNALTESSAVGIFQKYMDEQGQENAQIKAMNRVAKSCEQLVLESEFTATATCELREKNNRTYWLQVVFGKKPDGQWIVKSAIGSYVE